MNSIRMVSLFVVAYAAFADAAIFDAAGKKIPDSDASTTKIAWRKFSQSNPEKISGIAVLGDNTIGNVCTASYIDTGNPDGPAYVLSNGHCNFFEHWGFDPLRADEVRQNQTSSYFVTFNHHADVAAVERPVFKIRKLTYITESQTDVALYEIDTTQAELRKKGIRPLKISSVAPKKGDRATLIGIPLLNVDDDQKTLHASDCDLLETVALKNGIYDAPKSVRHRCASLPGFSGGPLVSSGEIILLNSHGSADDSRGDADCSYETRPCEVESGKKPVVREDLNYGQFVDGIAGCFGKDGKFDLSRNQCRLPK